MEFVKVMEIRDRMCKMQGRECSHCSLRTAHKKGYVTCNDVLICEPAKAEQLLIEWDKAHPVKTFLSDFLEKYPNLPLRDDGMPDGICPNMLGYTESDDCKEFCGNCLKCWSRPLEVQE